MQNKKRKKFSLADKSVPEKTRILMLNLVRFCPFRIDNKIDLTDIPITIKRDHEGYFFTCQVCTITQCSGYIRDDPSKI